MTLTFFDKVADEMISDSRLKSLLRAWASNQFDNGELVRRLGILREEVSLRVGAGLNPLTPVPPLSESEDEHSTFPGCA